MSLVALCIGDAILIAAEGNLTWTHFHAGAVHRFDEPSARQRHDPLGRGVFVPVADPAGGQHAEHRARGFLLQHVVPLRRGPAHALAFEVVQRATFLVADAVLVPPHVPVVQRGRVSAHWNLASSIPGPQKAARCRPACTPRWMTTVAARSLPPVRVGWRTPPAATRRPDRSSSGNPRSGCARRCCRTSRNRRTSRTGDTGSR